MAEVELETNERSAQAILKVEVANLIFAISPSLLKQFIIKTSDLRDRIFAAEQERSHYSEA
jgi:hypothetical protein